MFFFKEISGLRLEMKDLIQTKVTASIDHVNNVNEFLRADKNLNFLKEQCWNKDKVIKRLLEIMKIWFEREIINVSYKNICVKVLLSKISETELNPKCPLKINNFKYNSSRKLIKTFHRFDCLSEYKSLNSPSKW